MQNLTGVPAAAAMPSSRYQHGAVFVAGRLHISGGAVGGGRMVEDETVGVVLDTAAGCWCPLESQPAAADDWMRRCAPMLQDFAVLERLQCFSTVARSMAAPPRPVHCPFASPVPLP